MVVDRRSRKYSPFELQASVQALPSLNSLHNTVFYGGFKLLRTLNNTKYFLRCNFLAYFACHHGLSLMECIKNKLLSQPLHNFDMHSFNKTRFYHVNDSCQYITLNCFYWHLSTNQQDIRLCKLYCYSKQHRATLEQSNCYEVRIDLNIMVQDKDT